jgi:hypothetical protein
MFRSLFRVVVVAVVVLSFTLSLAQAGQAKPQDVRRPSVQAVAGSGWLGAAVRWLTGLITVGKVPPSGSGGHVALQNGSCIDPWGRNLCP